MRKKICFLFCFGFSFLFLMSLPAFADVGQIVNGFGKTLFSVFEIPKSMLQQSGKAFPLGIVTGALQGTYRTVMGTAEGAVQMAVGAAPYAKYMVFFL